MILCYPHDNVLSFEMINYLVYFHVKVEHVLLSKTNN